MLHIFETFIIFARININIKTKHMKTNLLELDILKSFEGEHKDYILFETHSRKGQISSDGAISLSEDEELMDRTINQFKTLIPYNVSPFNIKIEVVNQLIGQTIFKYIPQDMLSKKALCVFLAIQETQDNSIHILDTIVSYCFKYVPRGMSIYMNILINN